ncbi:hypothetical protein GWK47_016779 [Chionoecetes opilio]|uniref:Uncharacterized protein n=1 Tax=Chionoecetes opilio TaxID=41210 RepID=A0A8J4XWG9_CHIOP|nr:hypothetical protein GWK47_016779 [Chionoecetes opilio]
MSCCVSAGTPSSRGGAPLALTAPGQGCPAPSPPPAGVQWLWHRGVGGTDGRKVIEFSSTMPETPLSSPPPLGWGHGTPAVHIFVFSKLTCLRQSVSRTAAPASPSLQCGKFCKPSRDCQTSQELQRRTRMHYVTYPWQCFPLG